MAIETQGVEIRHPGSRAPDRSEEILTAGAVEFLALLHRTFNGERNRLLELRAKRQAELDGGASLDFLPETAGVRSGDWTVVEPAASLSNRRVEITGPTTAKMVINALNSGAPGFMADFEDSNSPYWANMVGGQVNLADAVRHRLEFDSPEGKSYRLEEKVATLLVRPRGWHLPERHIVIDDKPMSGSLMDFGLYFFHNAQELLDRGSGPFFYLPKMQSHREARLWNDVFDLSEDTLGIPRSSIRATVLIETIPAAFEMDEILYELREHSGGLNAGRWDYIFSAIKSLRTHDFVLPDRTEVSMTVPFMRAYTELLVATCHKRGAFAMGGMSAFLPSKTDEEVNRASHEKVREDKKREADAGFDGTWVAHPAFVAPALEQFDATLGDRPHQIDKLRPDVSVSASDLLAMGETPGEITETGLRANVNIGIQYISAWLRGNGAAGIYGLMEDAATAEISRSQVWQWIRNDAKLADTGEPITRELVQRLEDEELAKIRAEIGDDEWFDREGRPELAKRLFEQVALADEFVDFLTLPAYEELLQIETAPAA
ncbi:MAG: malate synthase A [Solirubrobacterales bacterium]|nr:malate synthase A [Solirubrobacterales bacterium]